MYVCQIRIWFPFNNYIFLSEPFKIYKQDQQ
jgi:hypothetical protein